MPKRGKLLWMDLEMTGLDPKNSKIIEVAVIVTDWKFNELAVYESIVKQPGKVIKKADQWVAENMQELLDESREADASCASKLVEEKLVDFVKKHIGTKDVILAGNSIHQDRRFIRSEWPELDAMLHYRMLDVSTYKIVAKGLKQKEFKKESSHRALEDIRDSIAELQYYLK